MEKNLLLAFLLMGAVLFLTPYFYKSQQHPPARPARPNVAATRTEETEKPSVTPAVPAPPAGQSPESPVAAVPVAAGKEELFTIDTKLYRIVLSNRGAVVRSWVLKQFKDSAGAPLELVNAPGAVKTGYPFSLVFKDKELPVNVNQVLYAPQSAAGGLGIDYSYSDGKVTVHKSFRFEQNSYLSQISSKVTQNGAGLPNLLAWRGGFGDPSVQNAAGQQSTLFFDTSSNKLNTKAAKNAPANDYGNYSFAGIEDKYFAAVFLPKASAQFDIRTVSDTVPGPADKTEQLAGAEVGGGTDNQFTLFVGPKDLDLLRKIDPRLEQMVDFGWFSLLAKPLFLVVNWLNDHIAHNYGWAIILATILINSALLPMRLKSMKSMKRMQTLAPQIATINAKYKNVGLRDPRKAEQNAEVMELYKKHGVNPMGGCLPMVIQLPFFIAFYKVLAVAIEMRGAHWLWVTDLSQPEQLAIRILPLADDCRAVPDAADDAASPRRSIPRKQKMMMFMPLMLGFMFYFASAGLVLYWLTSNVVGIVQQWFLNKSMPARLQ